MATDLVGRGVDVERVNIVINYDMPETDEVKGNGADTYLHRVSWAGSAVPSCSCLARHASHTITHLHRMSCCHLSVADISIPKLSGSRQVQGQRPRLRLSRVGVPWACVRRDVLQLSGLAVVMSRTEVLPPSWTM